MTLAQPGTAPPPLPAAVSTVDREYAQMMFSEHAEHARQHVTVRAMAAGFFMALIAGLLAFAVGEAGDHTRVVIAGGLVCLMSGLGMAINRKYSERYRHHARRRNAYCDMISANANPAINVYINYCRDIQRQAYPIFWRIELPWLWFFIYCSTLLMGGVVIYMGARGYSIVGESCSSGLRPQ